MNNAAAIAAAAAAAAAEAERQRQLEIQRNRIRTLIQGLQQVNNEIRSLSRITSNSKNFIRNNCTIDNQIFREDNYTKMESDANNILSNIEGRIISSLNAELSSLV